MIGFNPYLLTSKIWRASHNASKWQIGFNSEFKGLIEPMLEFFPESPHLNLCFQQPRKLKCYSCDGSFPDRAETGW
jgi:hypothetical protein